MKNIYLSLPSASQDMPQYVLATVTRTSGSTPQKPGSSALFSRAGLVAGTVGGGVLEGKVQEIALESVVTGRSGHYRFSLDKSVYGGEDALCGGKISVLIDADLKSNVNTFNELKESISARIGGVLLTRITEISENNVSINRYWMTEKSLKDSHSELIPKIEQEAMDMVSFSDLGDFREVKFSSDKDNTSNLIFLEPVIPPSRLLIAGAGHIGKALSKIGQMLDFDVTVADDRSEFANSDNIPYADHLIAGNIGSIVSKIPKGKDLFIVIVTRGHKDDSDALRACIGSDAAYIGMIGSRNKVALMQKEFTDKGWATNEQWNSIHSPVGLDINSKTVEEIAVSIAAQLIQVKNGAVWPRNSGKTIH
jgi:xanthine dehydrogenase accessory factor